MILFAADPSSFKEVWIPSPQELKLTYLSCEDPSNFHLCQHTDNLQEFESMMDEIQDYVASQNQSVGLSVSDLGTGQPVLAQFSKDKRWYRATVITADTDDTISVFYIDFGNRETLPSSKLCSIPDKFLSLPKLKLSCSLHDVEPCSGDRWREESIDCFSALLKECEFIKARVVKIVGNSRLEVSLCSKDGEVDFAKHLINEGHAKRK